MNRRGYDWEDYCARKHNGRKVKGSGNGLIKGDVRTATHLFECKYTDKSYYTLKLTDIQKLLKGAGMLGLEPAFFLSINGKRLYLYQIDPYRHETKRKSWRIREHDVGRIIETSEGTWQVSDDGPGIG